MPGEPTSFFVQYDPRADKLGITPAKCNSNCQFGVNNKRGVNNLFALLFTVFVWKVVRFFEQTVHLDLDDGSRGKTRNNPRSTEAGMQHHTPSFVAEQCHGGVFFRAFFVLTIPFKQLSKLCSSSSCSSIHHFLSSSMRHKAQRPACFAVNLGVSSFPSFSLHCVALVGVKLFARRKAIPPAVCFGQNNPAQPFWSSRNANLRAP